MRVQLGKFRSRTAWLLVLATLQRAPVLPVVKQAVGLTIPLMQKIWTWKAAVPTLAGSVATHALSGATTYVDSSDSNPAQATEGESFSFGFFTAGQHKAFSYKVEGLPDGLSYNGNVNGPLISGAPASAGSYEILITGYRWTGQSGNQTPAYSLSLVVSAGQDESNGSSSQGPWDDSNVEALGSGWWSSPWFGTFYGKDQGWLYHATHGWLYLQGTEESGFWVHDETLGWLYTGKEVYPFFYRDSTSTWLYDQSSSSERKFWDYASNLAITPSKR